MPKPSIQIYYDIVSPFAYLAYYTLRNSPTFKNVDVVYTPFFLGGVMKACGNTPPIAIRNKDRWIDRDRSRLAAAFGVPIADAAPDGFPVNTLAVMRALVVLQQTNPAQLLPATDALYAAVWGPARNAAAAHTPDGLAAVLGGVLGADETARVLRESSSAATKKVLADTVTRAVDEEGAFGAPYFVVTDAQGHRETYWGFNYLGMIATQLGLERDGRQGGWKSLL